MRRTCWPLVIAATLAFAGSASAELIDLGGGLIYDTALDLTWLQDANLAKTSGHAVGLYGTDTDGRMTWDDAMAWAETLDYGGVTGWRLPSALNINGSGPSDFGPDTEFRRLANYGIDCFRYNDPSDHSGPFDNLPAHWGYYDSVSYWTSTPDAGNTANAWAYVFEGPGYWAHYQGSNAKQGLAYAWAVRDGIVPEPAAIGVLVGTIVICARRRRP